MNETLLSARTWIEQQYDQSLGRDAREPVLSWHYVDRKDFNSAGGEDRVVILQDQALGLLLVLLPLDDEPSKVNTLVNDDLSLALRLRSELLPTYRGSAEPSGYSDLRGSWRVCLHWIVPVGAREAWTMAIMAARAGSGAFDEVAVDAIFTTKGQRIEEALEKHGLPRLLLTTRRVFAMPVEQVSRWADADAVVRKALSGLSNHFKDRRQRDIAAGIEQLAQNFVGDTDEKSTTSEPTVLNRLLVKNFRSLWFFKLDETPGKLTMGDTRTWVVHGPNGVGKTSIAEALALCSFGVSRRYKDFLTDRDETSGRTFSGYLTRYLKPAGKGSGASMPICEVNEKVKNLDQAGIVDDADTAVQKLIDAEGTLSSQEETGNFAQMKSSELYARVAGSFSRLAQEIESHLSQSYTNAHEKRRRNNARFGLTAAAKLRETISARIVGTRVKSELPGLSDSAAAFLGILERLGGSLGEEAKKLTEWWARVTVGEAYGQKVARLRNTFAGKENEEQIAATLLARVREYSQVVDATRALFEKFNAWRTGLEITFAEMAEQIRVWAQWEADRQSQTSQASLGTDTSESLPEEQKELSERLEELLKARADMESEGKLLRNHLEHVSTTVNFVENQWGSHPNTCPTCETDLASRGGVRQVVEALRATLESRIDERRKLYAVTSTEIKQTEAALRTVGQDACPISKRLREEINAQVNKLLRGNLSLESLLANTDTRADILKLVDYIVMPVSEPAEFVDLEGSSVRMAKEIIKEWRNADDIAEDPDAWEAVRKHVQDRLKDVVAQHLPATIERVWWEITASITPARWLLYARPRFAADLRRGAPQVHLCVGEDDSRLARYFFNNAEQHILGLAWLLTRHITHGRFQHAWLLLDDPAQEMDRPTFRDLARFLATLLRLYNVAEKPFTLALLLHQEERALDAARELDCGLYILGWTHEQNERALRRVALYGPGYQPPAPAKWFDKHKTSQPTEQ